MQLQHDYKKNISSPWTQLHVNTCLCPRSTQPSNHLVNFHLIQSAYVISTLFFLNRKLKKYQHSTYAKFDRDTYWRSAMYAPKALILSLKLLNVLKLICI